MNVVRNLFPAKLPGVASLNSFKPPADNSTWSRHEEKNRTELLFYFSIKKIADLMWLSEHLQQQTKKPFSEITFFKPHRL